MAQLANNFEAGTNGSNVTTGGGEASPDAFGYADGGGAITYDTTHAAHGTKAGKCTTGAIGWLNAQIVSQTDHYGRYYVYRTANPVTKNADLYVTLTSGTLRIYVNTSGQVEIAKGTTVLQTSTVTVNLNGWTRIEYHIVNNAVTGSFQVKIFTTPDGGTAAETLTQTSEDTSTASTEIYVGNSLATGGNSAFWIDDVIVKATSYPGSAAAAAPTNTVAPAVTGNKRVGQTLTTTNGTWTDAGSPAFTYQWQRDTAGNGTYANIGSATSNTYVLVTADQGCNVRCVDTDTDVNGATPANSNAVGLIGFSYAPIMANGRIDICTNDLVPVGYTPASATATAVDRSGGAIVGALLILFPHLFGRRP